MSTVSSLQIFVINYNISHAADGPGAAGPGVGFHL